MSSTFRDQTGPILATSCLRHKGNLKDASFSRLFPIDVARALSARLAIAVSFIHSRGFVHGGDLHLRNILTKLPASFHDLTIDQLTEKYGKPETVPVTRRDGKALPPNAPARAVVPLPFGTTAEEFTLADAKGLVLSDFGEAFAPATEQRLGKESHTPLPLRAPETFFEPESPLSYPSDIWSLGAAIWEILGMKFIFWDPDTISDLVAQQLEVLGDRHFPLSWRNAWERDASDEMPDDDIIPRNPTLTREPYPRLEFAFEEYVQKYRRTEEFGVYGEEETGAILELMEGMLRFNPEKRLTIGEVLQSRWMVQWALPLLK